MIYTHKQLALAGLENKAVMPEINTIGIGCRFYFPCSETGTPVNLTGHTALGGFSGTHSANVITPNVIETGHTENAVRILQNPTIPFEDEIGHAWSNFVLIASFKKVGSGTAQITIGDPSNAATTNGGLIVTESQATLVKYGDDYTTPIIASETQIGDDVTIALVRRGQLIEHYVNGKKKGLRQFDDGWWPSYVNFIIQSEISISSGEVGDDYYGIGFQSLPSSSGSGEIEAGINWCHSNWPIGVTGMPPGWVSRS